MTFRAGVIGATGYAGGEIIRTLAGHPGITVAHVAAASSAGRRLGEFHPHLPAFADRIVEAVDPARLAACDVVFLALPHGASGEVTSALVAQGTDAVIVDCGADHRLVDEAEWAHYYGGDYAGAWTYGMPELLHDGERVAAAQREQLRTTRRIAVPGCNVTAVTLAVQPFVDAIDTGAIQATLTVGYSGAGKAMKPHLMASQALGGAQPYAVGGSHRHIPEIIQNLRCAGAADPAVTMTPVLAPFTRGILAVVTAPVRDAVACEHALDVYAKETFVTACTQGVWPTTAAVVGSGRCLVQATIDERAGTLVALAAIDNLGKGTASQAVQTTNLALGLDEAAALVTEGVAP